MILCSTNVARCCLGDKEVYHGYQMVEYIKNTSDSGGLDTKIKNSITDYSVEAKFKQDDVSVGIVLGTSTRDAGTLWFYSTSNSFAVYANSPSSWNVLQALWSPSDTEAHVVKFEGQQDHCTITWDEENPITGDYTDPQQYSTNNLAVFGRGTKANCYIGRIYYVKVWNTSTQELLLDYVPCYRKSDNTPGFWDRVTKTFKTIADASAKWESGPDVD